MDQKDFISSWQEIRTIIDEALEKGNQTVSIYISPDGGMSVTVSPFSIKEEEDA